MERDWMKKLRKKKTRVKPYASLALLYLDYYQSLFQK